MPEDSNLYDVVDAVAQGSTPADISDAIKNALYDKAVSRIDTFKPEVAKRMFGIEDANENDVEEPEEGE